MLVESPTSDSETTLHGAFLGAREGAPTIELDYETFERYCRELGEADPAEAPRSFESLFLCCACLQRNEAACRVFQETYGETIRRAVARIESNPGNAEEVTACFMNALFVGRAPLLRRYKGRGPLSAWLKTSASRAALDAQRRRNRAREEPLSLTPAPPPSMSPESMQFCHTHGGLLIAALDRALNALPEAHRMLLRLHYVEGQNVDALGNRAGVHRATAARWLQRAREDIESAVQRDLREARGFEKDEVQSLLRGTAPYLEARLRERLEEPSVESTPQEKSARSEELKA